MFAGVRWAVRGATSLRGSRSIGDLGRRQVPAVFDRQWKRAQRDRIAALPECQEGQFDYLHAEVMNRLLERLSLVRRTFPRALAMGALSGHVVPALLNEECLSERPDMEFVDAVKMSGEQQRPDGDASLASLPPMPYLGGIQQIDLLEMSAGLLHRDAARHQSLIGEHYARMVTEWNLVHAPEYPNVGQFDPLHVTRQQYCEDDGVVPAPQKSEDDGGFSLSSVLPWSSQPELCGDPDYILPRSTYDVVISPLSLHWCNDLPGVLERAMFTLKPDGCILGAMFVDGTLPELRSSLLIADAERRGGVQNHVSPFTRLQNLGDLLHKAGFHMVSVDAESICVPFPDLFTCMEHLQMMGEAHAPAHAGGFVGQDVFLAAAAVYQEVYGDASLMPPELTAAPTQSPLVGNNFQIGYFIAWKPHESQQQPARRGSGKVHFSDVLE